MKLEERHSSQRQHEILNCCERCDEQQQHKRHVHPRGSDPIRRRPPPTELTVPS
jgi:hypothetical protein